MSLSCHYSSPPKKILSYFFPWHYTLFKCLGIVVSIAFASPIYAQQCGININKVTVSNCYYVNNQSKVTLSIEVSWQNPPAGDSIEVALGSEKRYIKPGTYQVSYPATTIKGNQTIVSPQVVAFEVNATGINSNVTAHFTTLPACTDTEVVAIPNACPPLVCDGTHTGGIVFSDYNANGIRDTGEINGIDNVTVTATACDGTVYTTTTDASGIYIFDIPQANYPIRVEFSNLPSYAGQGTIHGADGRTTVQFVDAPNCNIDLGVLDNNDFCQTTPKIVVPCYVSGNPEVGSTSGQMDALVAFDYGTSGPKDMLKITVLAKAETVGTLWGVAYDKYTNKTYTSASLKRHAGLGPLGLGGIYVTDMVTNTTSNYIDVSASPLNINVGASTASDPWFGVTNASRGLLNDPAQPSNDAVSFALIGKVGIGDLEISEDGKALYFVNLYDKKLYKLDISVANNPTLAGSWAIPDPGCVDGSMRPFATKVYKGKVYVGSVCDASSSTKSNLRGYVTAFDGTTFAQVFDFPLTYPKGAVLVNSTPAVVDRVGWYPWTDNFNDINSNTTNGTFVRILHPQPMLTDIEFDIDGSMVLALGDRTGLQSGYNNYPLSGTGVYTGLSGGDILRAAFTNGTYILENNGKVPGFNGAGVNNNQGPGFGEFYNDDFLGGNGGLTHAEIGFGALALKPGSGQVIMTAMDPVDQNQTGTNFSGGVRYLSNTTGLSPTGPEMGFVLYNTNNESGTFGKSTGLGDLEVTCLLPNYLEVGNRVWIDTNQNGIQDPCEKALKDVNVSLYKGNTLIATTTTNLTGDYYFSSKSKIGSGTWLGVDADTVLLPNTSYQIVFGTGNQVNASGDTLTIAGLGKFILTQANAGSNDLIDSDAAISTISAGTYPSITITTGAEGSVDHTFDAGFYCILPYNETISVKAATCTGTGQSNNDASIRFTNIKCADKFAYSIGSVFSGNQYDNATAITGDSIVIANLPNPTFAADTFTVRLYNGVCCYKDTTIILPKTICPLGSLGNFIWKDLNNNGRQDALESGVKDVVVLLLKNSAVIGSDTTDSNGYYNFDSLATGDYQVQILVSSLPEGCTISSQYKAAGVPDSLNSDFDPTTAISPIVSINALGNGIDKDNPTIDGALYSPKGSIGDFVWKDLNNNGIQDSGEAGVEGVILELYKGSTTSAAIATDTTDSNGKYEFTNLDAGDYYVKIVTQSLPVACILSDSTNKGGDDALDSDFDSATGFSPKIVINPLNSGIDKDNPTIDAALVKPCVAPTWTITTAPSCSPTTPVYSVSFAVLNPNGSLKVNAGTLTSTSANNYTVAGIPNGVNLVIIDSLSATCKFDTTLVAPDCSCPQVTVLTPNISVCIGDTIPTLSVNVVGNAGVEWYRSGSNQVVATGLTFKPSGIVSATDTFYVQLTGVSPLCVEQTRTAIVVTALDCQVDLALRKSISRKIAHIGDTLTYSIKVWNEFTNNASGVEVTDSIPSSVAFIVGSFNASRGTASISNQVIKWNIGNITANGDTVTLTYKIKVIQEGVHFNKAEISKTDQPDKDSTPNNNSETEDDLDRQCFSVPFKLCVGEKVQVNLPAHYTGVVWFKDGGSASVAQGNEVLFSETGSYTFTATNNTCPVEGCCPVIIEPSDNCCPADLCIPVIIHKTKKTSL